LKEGLKGGSHLSAGRRDKRESGPAEWAGRERSWAGGNKRKRKRREKKRRWAAGRDGPGWVGPKRKREREGEKGVVKDFSFFSKPF
jgi:hypothetical protein